MSANYHDGVASMPFSIRITVVVSAVEPIIHDDGVDVRMCHPFREQDGTLFTELGEGR